MTDLTTLKVFEVQLVVNPKIFSKMTGIDKPIPDKFIFMTFALDADLAKRIVLNDVAYSHVIYVSALRGPVPLDNKLIEDDINRYVKYIDAKELNRDQTLKLVNDIYESSENTIAYRVVFPSGSQNGFYDMAQNINYQNYRFHCIGERCYPFCGPDGLILKSLKHTLDTKKTHIVFITNAINNFDSYLHNSTLRSKILDFAQQLFGAWFHNIDYVIDTISVTMTEMTVNNKTFSTYVTAPNMEAIKDEIKEYRNKIDESDILVVIADELSIPCYVSDELERFFSMELTGDGELNKFLHMTIGGMDKNQLQFIAYDNCGEVEYMMTI